MSLYKDIITAPHLFSKVVRNGRLVSKPDNNIKMIMGHARAATLGSVIVETSHPFNFSGLVGCHNGTCHNMVPKDLTKEEKESIKASDSWNIFNLMNQQGLDKTLETIKDGAFALVWYDKNNSTLNFIRNEKRPLFFGSTGGTLYWASEEQFLEMIKQRTRFNISIKEAEPYQLYSIDVRMPKGVNFNQEDKSSILKPTPVVIFSSKHFSAFKPAWEEELEKHMQEEEKEKPSKTSVPSVSSTKMDVSGGSLFERIATNPPVSLIKVFDYFQCLDKHGVIVSEPSLKEAKDEMMFGGCCVCGKDHGEVTAPQHAYFNSDKEQRDNFSTFYYVCNDCVIQGDNYFSDYEEEAYELRPKYRP